jgi:hypothetical protein
MSDSNQWPAWRYGPDGEADVFENEADVPKGWKNHPSAFEKPAKEAKAKPAGEQAGNADVDAAGVAFDPALHAASRSFTSKGLWRMKVGVKRPEAPTLDL